MKVQGNLPRCCHTIRKSSQDKSSDREGISSGHQTVQGEGETFVRIFKPKETWRLVLEDRREDLFAGAKSEILKQECKVDFLNTSTREFQREAHSSRLEMDNVNCGYEESRREQARLQEELVQREKVLRESHTREVEELKRAQEMRHDEFSRHELKESHATTQELTSQIQELQDRKNCMN